MADKNDRRDFISDTVKMGGAAGMAALAMAVPAKGDHHKVEKNQAGVRIGNLVFTSGLTGTRKGSPSDFGGSVEEQTRTILQKQKDNLEAIGSSLNHVLKVTVFQSDIKVEKPAMNKAYAEFFTDHKPSRSAVGVEFPDSRTKVEIEMIAYVPDKG
jgi:2-iminobutanoate/2-iminopropanoate deaminase